MKLLKALALSFIAVGLSSCDKKEESAKDLYALEIRQDSKELHAETPLSLSIENKKHRKIDSIVYQIFTKNFTFQETTLNQIPTNGEKLGQHVLRADIYSNGQQHTLQSSIVLLADAAPKVYGFEILEEYPHDSNAFTQGLEFYGEDMLYESTGQYGSSSLRKVDLKTGEVLKKVNLPAHYFGEGLSILNDKIYQLSWRENVGFIYDLHSLEKLSEFPYQNSKEGWGICNDGTNFYKSDGTERIWILDPISLQEQDYIQVYTNTGRLREINELEWVEGKIFANVFTRNAVSIINPTTGKLEGVIDFSSLVKKIKTPGPEDVLNGIAYKGEKDIIYVTGKNWDKLFKIKIVEK